MAQKPARAGHATVVAFLAKLVGTAGRWFHFARRKSRVFHLAVTAVDHDGASSNARPLLFYVGRRGVISGLIIILG